MLINYGIILTQALFALAIAIFSFRVLQSLKAIVRAGVQRPPAEAFKHFRPALRWIIKWIFYLTPFTSRFSRSSVAIQRQLTFLGLTPEVDDLVFSQLRLALLLALGLCTAGLVIILVGLGSGHLVRSALMGAAVLGVAAFVLPRVWLFDRVSQLRRSVLRGFPSFLDVLALVLESGQNFQSALQLAIQHLGTSREATALKEQLVALAQDIRAGQTKSIALQRFSDRLALAEITQFVASIRAADQQGVSVTALLRRQAEQLRTSRALEAERQAMKLPVKLLMPLAICIFPCTFMVLAVPLVSRLAGSGLF